MFKFSLDPFEIKQMKDFQFSLQTKSLMHENVFLIKIEILPDIVRKVEEQNCLVDFNSISLKLFVA